MILISIYFSAVSRVDICFSFVSLHVYVLLCWWLIFSLKFTANFSISRFPYCLFYMARTCLWLLFYQCNRMSDYLGDVIFSFVAHRIVLCLNSVSITVVQFQSAYENYHFDLLLSDIWSTWQRSISRNITWEIGSEWLHPTKIEMYTS